MIGELVVIAVVVLVPATVILGSLAFVALGVAGFALDPEERRLLAR